MHALPIIEREWPSVAADLRDDVSADTVRDRSAETFDGEEYGRLAALLEVYEAEQASALSADARAVIAGLVADESEHGIDADPVAAPAVWEEIRAAFPFALYAAREGEAR